MTAVVGNLDVQCPTCGRHVVIPVTCSGPIRQFDGRTVLAVDIDREVVRAHELTHGPHDGEPMPRAA